MDDFSLFSFLTFKLEFMEIWTHFLNFKRSPFRNTTMAFDRWSFTFDLALTAIHLLLIYKEKTLRKIWMNGKKRKSNR